MSQVPYSHQPAMEREIVAALRVVPDGILVDATLGGGGHSAAILAAHPGLRLLGLDRDPAAIEAASVRLAGAIAEGRAQLRGARFDVLGELAAEVFPGEPVTAVVFDLGVSSPQLDRSERGFSYRHRGPLDMRMDPTQAVRASDVVNGYAEERLARLFRENGEARFGGRIARAVVAHRPFEDTVALAEVVRDAIPAATRRRGGHPAKRVFQAIRIGVNAELDVLGPALRTALDVLAPGGRLAVLTYHSGEDRLVKGAFVEAATGGCVCPPGLPCVCGATARHRLVFRGSRTPGADEVARNRRAESARLRVIERIPDNPEGTA